MSAQKNGLQRVFQDYKPQIVFHLAAQSLVRLSYEEPSLTYETNVLGTVNLLEAVRQTPSVRVVVNVTSDKCYENKNWVWGYREIDPIGGHDPYSSSKGCAELVTQSYLRSFFPPENYGSAHSVALASVRAGNVIGGGDWGADRLLPDCMRALSKGDKVVIRSPEAFRPWQHVLEPLGGYLLLGAKLWKEGPRYAGAWNFGPREDEEWTVEKVVREVIHLWGRGSYGIDGHGQPHEASRLKLDCSKARLQLNWKPRYSLKQSLDHTVSWYKKFYSGASVDEIYKFTQQQINNYKI